MSQTDRKYDGAPHSESKRLPAEPPNRLAPRKSKTTQQPEYIVNVWNLSNREFPNDEPWWWLGRGKRRLTHVPCLGTGFGGYSLRAAMEHVIKRLKAVIRKSRPCGIYWLEQQGTKRQISPEFSNFKCFMNWVIYKGFAKGWLEVAGFKDRNGKVCRRLEKR
jgi:hypothetical protein